MLTQPCSWIEPRQYLSSTTTHIRGQPCKYYQERMLKKEYIPCKLHRTMFNGSLRLPVEVICMAYGLLRTYTLFNKPIG
ncbi:hypothetical protein OPV22_031968 [Ensete ventricosum]|uniref:Uncharacterized protein n=1 Tax=Ensete ventricosum TaxID=4639 RepID=A0AAV8PVA4_ENSVE|nr:hypothetical protein OPV22_031968 [Ensete ventricosum]